MSHILCHDDVSVTQLDLSNVLVTVVNGALVLYSENLWEILKWHMKTRLRFCFGLVEKN